MPRRNDLKTILIIGSGPIVIGQACEFDYSGTQACRALKEEGYRVVLVNSNPATIMTSPEMADSTYIEPIEATHIAKIIERERPDALLPTMGGQTALNTALDLHRQGILDEYGVELIGAKFEAIEKAENRSRFFEVVQSLGLKTPRSIIIRSLDEAMTAVSDLGLPIIVRPSYTLGGTGGGIAYSEASFLRMCEVALKATPGSHVELSESLLGFKEFELEVIRDKNDNAIVVCSIENIDPMGVHTGDSITVAPQQTLTDKEYQVMRDQAFQIIRAIGVETGGANVQFAVNPSTGEQFVIEMNPRVSRSSALASKATGFPIAKVAAKLAVGYTLDELGNDMTGGLTPASFEPMLDYVVTKWPYFQFAKFPNANKQLTTQMHSVGEVMAIGRTFIESFMKALASLEIPWDLNLGEGLETPSPTQIFSVLRSLTEGMTVEELYEKTNIDPWFLAQFNRVFRKDALEAKKLASIGLSREQAKRLSSDKVDPIAPERVYKHVDSCAAEFPVSTNYLYSTIGETCEVERTQRKRVLIIGSGPNRIGQGIEFDYACVEAVTAARAQGYEVILVNSNPETVSTDYDISDKLYFEPVDAEHVISVISKECPEKVMVQFGGQTPINMLKELVDSGRDELATVHEWVELSEDRERFNGLLKQLGYAYTSYASVIQLEAAKQFTDEQGFPVLLRPSFVLGGARMRVVRNESELAQYFETFPPQAPLQIERFLEEAIEVDVDAISDGKKVLIGGVLEHVEAAGVHSGDSIQVTPPYTLPQAIIHRIERMTRELALTIGIVGPLNLQYAVQGETIYVLELNPRASRSLPFLAKSTGRPLARIAMRCLLGESLQAQGYGDVTLPSIDAVKVPVFVFHKFKGADPELGPEMKSTGEVMGLGMGLLDAARKAFRGAAWPKKIRQIFVSLRSREEAVRLSSDLSEYQLSGDKTTTEWFRSIGLHCTALPSDEINLEQFDMIINTNGSEKSLRMGALDHEVCYISSLRAALLFIRSAQHPITSLNSLQFWQQEVLEHAACTDDEERRGEFKRRARAIEESGAA